MTEMKRGAGIKKIKKKRVSTLKVAGRWKRSRSGSKMSILLHLASPAQLGAFSKQKVQENH